MDDNLQLLINNLHISRQDAYELAYTLERIALAYGDDRKREELGKFIRQFERYREQGIEDVWSFYKWQATVELVMHLSMSKGAVIGE